jgi:hypothetical protein
MRLALQRATFGESMMLDSFRIRLLPVFALLLAGCLLISPRSAHAQFADGEKKWAVLDVAAAINRAIDESKGGVELREKVVRRFSECALVYGALSKLAMDPQARKSYIEAQLLIVDAQATIAEPLKVERFREIMAAAKPAVGRMVGDLNRHDDKELAPFLKSCKSLNEVSEINNAVRELSRQ